MNPPPIRGLCIGTGEWLRVAQRAAAQMSRQTGLACEVISRVDANLVHSAWHKLNLLRDYPGETLFIFDADIWCRRPWDPALWRETGLAMVPEPPFRPVKLESLLYGIAPGRYCNSGLIIADQRAAGVFAVAKKLHPHYGSWLEQTAINHCAREFPFQPMPQTLNHQVRPALPLPEICAVPAINLHFTGRKTVARLHEIFDALAG